MTRRFNSLGFWAIGSGAPAALSSLSFHISRKQLTVYSSVSEAVYFSLAAKFMAESANDVGKSTFVVILSNHDSEPLEYVSDQGIEKIRKLWERSGAPRVPRKDIENTVSKLIYPSKASSIEAVEAREGGNPVRRRCISNGLRSGFPPSRE